MAEPPPFLAPAFTALVRSLPQTVPFVPPEAMERASGKPFRARLGANENAFGPSPRVVAAMAAAAPEMWKYCDPTNHDLKTALARHHGIAPESIAVGAGIDGLLGHIVRLFAEPGSVVVTSLGAYPTFNFHVAGYGARLHFVPFRDDREDLDALAEAAHREDVRLVYLSNPDSPMGTWWDASAIARFIDALPRPALLILDEAYGETAPPGTLPPLDPARPNVLRLRTFSKAYGLAGLRLGYAIGHPDVAAGFDKVRDHFGVSRMAQAAGLAALADQQYLEATVARIAAARARIAAIAAANGLLTLPSATNFVAVDCGGDGTFAGRVLEELIVRGVFVRKPAAPGLDRCIRVSAGLDDEIDFLAETLPHALEAARAPSDAATPSL